MIQDAYASACFNQPALQVDFKLNGMSFAQGKISLECDLWNALINSMTIKRRSGYAL